MDYFTRRYLLFQGYCFAAASAIGSIFLTLMKHKAANYFSERGMFNDFRFISPWMYLLGACWFCCGVSLFYGLYQEKVMFLYPFPAMFTFELFLLLIRDIYMYYGDGLTYFDWFNVFLDPYSVVILFYLTIHVMLTMVALGKMFIEMPSEKSSRKFLRFGFKRDAENAAGAS